MESWKKTWREGVAPLLPTKGLLALRQALADDDPRLLQGATTSPPPLRCVQDWDCEGACPVAFAAWHGNGLETVGDVEEAFAGICFEADQRLGEPAAIRWLLNWADTVPREEMRRLLIEEINLTLSGRRDAAADAVLGGK